MQMPMVLSMKIKEKLQGKSPAISKSDIEECFANRCGTYLMDLREDHLSDPPTLWFVAENDRGAKIKVVFIQKGIDIYIRTAYVANPVELEIYARHANVTFTEKKL